MAECIFEGTIMCGKMSQIPPAPLKRLLFLLGKILGVLFNRKESTESYQFYRRYFEIRHQDK